MGFRTSNGTGLYHVIINYYILLGQFIYIVYCIVYKFIKGVRKMDTIMMDFYLRS